MVRADAQEGMAEVFETFHYGVLSRKTVDSADAAFDAMEWPRDDKPRTTVHKAVTFVNGWTVVFDPEMVMISEEDAMTALARRYDAPVFGMICEGASASYAFSFFNPEPRRAYFVSDGEVGVDRGEPLPEEADIDVSSLFEDDVLEVMTRLGVPYSEIETAGSFDVWELDESGLAEAEPPVSSPSEPVRPANSASPASPAKPVRPWWRLW